MKKVCTKCQDNLDVENFYWRDKSLGIRRGQCKKCASPTYKKHYQNNKDKIKARTRAQRAKARAVVNDLLKGSQCADCGNQDVRVLEFDHLRDKSMAISRMISTGVGSDRIRQEALKCDIVCANCHRIRTSITQNWNK